MNDGFDSRLCYDKKAFFSAIDSEFSEESLLHNMSFLLSILNNQMGGLLQTFIAEESGNESSIKKTIMQTLGKIHESIMNNQDSIMDYLMTSMQSNVKMSCLCENISSPDMWGHYANSEEGFALQYDCSNLLSEKEDPNELDSKSNSIYPVIYQNNRYNIPVPFVIYLFKQRMYMEMFYQFFGTNLETSVQSSQLFHALSIVNPCPDESLFTKLYLYKSNEWKVEKEWRILYGSKDPKFTQTDYAYKIIKPTAVYLGRRMKENSRKLIIDIAKEKKIPIYQMKINDSSSKYLLKPERITCFHPSSHHN